MAAYTKDQFEHYKGDKEFLEVKYYSNPVIVAHKTYEEYRKYFDDYYLIEQDNFERDRLIVSRELADIKSVQDYMYYCAEEDIDFIEKWKIEDYDKVYNLSRQKNSYKKYAIDKGAEPSKAAILKKLEAQLEKAYSDRRSAELSIEWIIQQIEELK